MDDSRAGNRSAAQDDDASSLGAGGLPAEKEAGGLGAKRRLELWARGRTRTFRGLKPPSLVDAIRRQAESNSDSGDDSSRASLSSRGSGVRGGSWHSDGIVPQQAAFFSPARGGKSAARAASLPGPDRKAGDGARRVLPRHSGEGYLQENANREEGSWHSDGIVPQQASDSSSGVRPAATVALTGFV